MADVPVAIIVGTAYGSQSMVDPLRIVLVRRPDRSFEVDDPNRWGYTSKPNLAKAQEEHDAFVGLLREREVDVRVHDQTRPGKADSIFVHDPAIVTDQGAVLLRMGKDLRRGEEEAMGRVFEELGIPILAGLKAPATAEGGDLLWVDRDTLAVGRGFRTNEDGLRQLRDVMNGLHVDVLPVPLPYFRGPSACLHLMSLISIVDDDLAVIYPRLFPVPFWQQLRDRGFDFVEVPDAEFDTMAPNVLAVRPRDCIMIEGNPVTKECLEHVGCRVHTYRGHEISMKAEGGATCLTRPILRRR